MSKLLVLAAMCAGMTVFAVPDSANAGHYPRSGGYGYGYDSGYGGRGYGGPSYRGRSFRGGYDAHYGRYGAHGSRGYGYGHRYIDPYHGDRLRHRAYHHYDVILGSQGFGFRYGR